MIAHNLGYPRIGSHRELKRACEQFWAGNIQVNQLEETARNIRQTNWLIQQAAGISLIPCNDFSYYDQVLDMCLTVGAVPARYRPLAGLPDAGPLTLYFAMARGYQQQGFDLKAMEMTKCLIPTTITWFRSLRLIRRFPSRQKRFSMSLSKLRL